MLNRGIFITIEGGEGVGKSTNIAFLDGVIKKLGVEVITTREPGGTRLGEDIRSLLLGHRAEPVNPMAELLLIFAARAQHISEVIEPALAKGKWVLCDRFTDATYAYQCGGRGIDVDSVRCLENLVQRGLRPDFTLILDAPVSIGMARARVRGSLDRFEQESEEFFNRVRSVYLEQASRCSEQYHVIDVSRSLDDVQRELMEFAKELLSQWRNRAKMP